MTQTTASELTAAELAALLETIAEAEEVNLLDDADVLLGEDRDEDIITEYSSIDEFKAARSEWATPGKATLYSTGGMLIEGCQAVKGQRRQDLIVAPIAADKVAIIEC